MNKLSLGFVTNIPAPKKQLSKGIDIRNKDFYELLIRTVNTPNASIYIWRIISPLTRVSTMFSDLYTYEIKKLNITQETIRIIDALNDRIYLKLIGYIWDSSLPTQIDSSKVLNKDFLGICIDLDVFANYVQKRIVNKGKFNIKKRVFYLVGDKRV
jgi:hypothetical protein